MKEKLVDFKTAIMAKEKGFDIPCEMMYIEESDGAITYITAWDKDLEPDYFKCGLIFIPTQSLLQKWIREKYKLNSNVRIYKKDEWRPVVQDLNPLEQDGFIKEVFLSEIDGKFQTYELALEESLYKTLEKCK
jgi:hypothetical protein